MERRYMGNIPSISESEQELLKTKHVLIAGCGGVGGYAAEYLARLGVGKITIIDNGSFELQGLHCELFADTDTVGKSKVTVIKEHLQKVNPQTEVEFWMSKLRKATVMTALSGKNLVLDGLEDTDTRLILADGCREKGIPFVYGAVFGWMFQVMTVSPERDSLRTFYKNNAVSTTRSTLSFVPAVCAAVQVSEAVKLLCGKEPEYLDQLLIWDMKTMESRKICPEEAYFQEQEIEIFVSKYNQEKEAYTVPEKATVRDILTVLRLEGETLYIMRNGQYVMPEDFNRPVLEEGDYLEIRKAAFGG